MSTQSHADGLTSPDLFPLTRKIAQSINFDAPKGARAIIAMSGGVDSSVTAALCHYAGYEVVGLTLQLYDHGVAVQKKRACCAGQDIYDARQVASRLGIAHYVLDYENVFSDAVMEDFADSYLAGATPIPCIRCNERVKFEDMLTTARELGGAFMATGHYIRREAGDSKHEDGGRATLHRAHDQHRDQSYFLFTTTPAQLDFLRFPLGGLPKSVVREIAAELGLTIADKPDSQDICFVPDGTYANVVERLRPQAATPGEIVHIDGTVMGQHPGIMHYTIGQRRGLGVATGAPLYVVKLEADTARVIVGPKEALGTRHIYLKDVNWLGDMPLGDFRDKIQKVAVKIRSTTPPIPAQLIFCGSDGEGDNAALRKAHIELKDPEDGIAPGQACVFYDPAAPHNRLLGGGWISHADQGRSLKSEV